MIEELHEEDGVRALGRCEQAWLHHLTKER
jgi:hypothetical protein